MCLSLLHGTDGRVGGPLSAAARYPVLQLREENQTFAIVKGGKVDFFPNFYTVEAHNATYEEQAYKGPKVPGVPMQLHAIQKPEPQVPTCLSSPILLVLAANLMRNDNYECSRRHAVEPWRWRAFAI